MKQPLFASLLVFCCLAVPTLRAENLARAGIASQTSISSGGLPARAIDGNRDGLWANNSVTHTADPGADNDYWIVDLGMEKVVDSVTLWNRTDTCCGNRMSNLRIGLLNGSSNEVYGVDIPNSNPVAAGGNRSFPMPYGSMGRYVRVQSLPGNSANGNNIISLAEVEVWGHNTLTNVARHPNALATQSSVTSSGAAARAIDGNTDPVFTDGSVTHTDPAVTNGTYWEVNLGSVCPIQEIWLFNRMDCCADRLSNFRLSIYNGAAEVYGQNVFTNAAGITAGGTFSNILSSLIEGDRVRVSLINNTNRAADSVLSLTEVQVIGKYGPDLTPPQLVEVYSLSTNTLLVKFSEPVSLETATNASNYSVTNGSGRLTIQSATLSGDGKTVRLATTGFAMDTSYTLSVSGLRDRSSLANLIAPGSSINFTTIGLLITQIGGGSTNSSLSRTPDGLTATNYSAGAGSSTDQIALSSVLYQGNFDVRVQVNELTQGTPWSRAGIMARNETTDSSPFFAVWASPGISGCFAQYRAPGSPAVMQGQSPVNAGQTWLRLKREGNSFTGYVSYDGLSWMPLTSTTLALEDPVFLGLAVTSQSAGQAVVARLSGFGEVTATNAFTPQFRGEPIGPSSRRTGLVFSEIMYHPAASETNGSLEFIEIVNTQSTSENLSGYEVTGSIHYLFPTGTKLPPGGMVVLARDPAALQTRHGSMNILGPWDNAGTEGLPDDTGTVRLRNELGAVLLEVVYQANPPWPVAADGSGHSLVLLRPSYGEGNPAAWGTSDLMGGSPGRLEPLVATEPLQAVVINEVLAHSTNNQPDFVELYNHSRQPVDLSGAWLSDTLGTNKFRIPDGTVLGATSHVCFFQQTLGFGLEAAGERVVLVNATRTRVVDAVEFGAQLPDHSWGRQPDGGAEFGLLSSVTPGAPNATTYWPDVIINEIMFSPITGNDDDEYVELFNRGANAVNLRGWRLVDGVSFTFTNQVWLPAGGYLAIARNASQLQAKYPGTLNATNLVGNYSGSLKNGGERLALSQPEVNPGSGTGYDVVVNEVTYGGGGRWGDWSSGGGSSLELINPWSDNRRADNWSDSDETAKAGWTTIQYTGPLGETLGTPVNDQLHFYMLGAGECLLDDLAVKTNLTYNLLTNGGFNAGLGGWVLQGSHDQSVLETNATSGEIYLHVRSGSRGDMGANRIRSSAFTLTNTVTLSGRVRWLRGWPEVLLRLRGGGMEAFGKLSVPGNLGTPGQPNSRLIANAGPAIYAVQHEPILPAANETITVGAQVSDPQGVAELYLQYRLDPATNLVRVPMVDDGTQGDRIPGDGVYSATVPGQPNGTLVAFHVLAVDSLGATNTFPREVLPPANQAYHFPVESPTHECLVRVGEPQMSGAFGTYHMWMTQGTRNRWATRYNLSNSGVDVTMAYNQYRVVYNARSLYSGSPFHRGQMTTGPDGGNRCDYIVNLPDDDTLFGETDINLALPGNGSGGNSTDLSAQAEQISYVFFRKMGIPFNHRRYVHLFVNGSQRSTVSGLSGNFIYEDTQQPNSAFLKQWFPDDPDGQLIKIEDWFEFNDDATAFSNNDADLHRRVVSGSAEVNLAPYRYMWRPRSITAGDSANNYTNFLKLLNTVSPTVDVNATVDITAFNQVAHLDEWLREISCQKAVGNFDSFGYDRGKNNYLYKPTQGRFQLLPWDVDWTMGTGSGRGPTDVVTNSSDKRMVMVYHTPETRRAFFRAFKNLTDGPFQNAYINPIIDEKAAALSANGVTYSEGTVSTLKTYVNDRRAYLTSLLSGLTNTFSVPGTNYYSTNLNYITLSGLASIEASEIRVNGSPWPVTWNANLLNWTMKVPLDTGINQLVIQAIDWQGQPLAGKTVTNTVVFTGSAPPTPAVVISEIMYHPLDADGEYVELFNTSTNFTYNLSGWSINGLGYTFPPGSLLAPTNYLVLARNRAVFQTLYPGVAVFDEFSGDLQQDGETLSLLRPGAEGPQIMDQVRYDTEPPWPTGSQTLGSSLQLVDANRDNSRVANWSDGTGWRFASYSGNVTGAALLKKIIVYPDLSGEIYIDDLSLVTGTVANAGINIIPDGSFENANLFTNQGGVWTMQSTYGSQSRIDTNFAHSGRSSMHLIFTNVGTTVNNVILEIPITNMTYTLSFWYLPASNFTTVTFRFGSLFQPKPNVRPNYRTPGSANSVAQTWPALPPVWLNEVAPNAVSGVTNNAGETGPWLEIHNPSTNLVDLGGLYLTDDLNNLTRFRIPTNTLVQPGQFLLVWTDGATQQNAPEFLHTDFTLGGTNGIIALTMVINGEARILDYLAWKNLWGNRTFGSYPDGQPFYRDRFDFASPGQTNSPALRPTVVRINEWMADNANAIAQPGLGTYDDWLELFNPGDETVDLSGWRLTDSNTNGPGFAIPGGVLLPARAHLVVWADNQASLNQPGGALHTNFRLSRSGDTIALFNPADTLVDLVQFGPQVRNGSAGRYPDGSDNLQALTLATPGQPNQSGTNSANQSPTLAPFVTRVLVLGQTLMATALAADPDLPVQNLTFSKVAGPAGLTIHPATGVIGWQPAPGDVGTNTVLISVTDSGQPPLSATNTLTIVVRERPRFQPDGLRLQSQQVRLLIPTSEGKNYRVEYLDQIGGTWQRLGTNAQPGTGSDLEFMDEARPNRFYRIVVED
jgi:hypothetical protein